MKIINQQINLYMSKYNKSTGGISFCSLLGLLFIGLKLGGVITWSWWWVLAPIWIPIALVIITLVIIFVIMYYIDIR